MPLLISGLHTSRPRGSNRSYARFNKGDTMATYYFRLMVTEDAESEEDAREMAASFILNEDEETIAEHLELYRWEK